MDQSILIGMIPNIAILLAFTIVYEYFGFSSKRPSGVLRQMLIGVFIGVTTIILILTPWNFSNGVFFDTRSVLLSVSGLFFGPLPTLVGAAIGALFRHYQGGVGAPMGVGVIFTAALCGILWSKLFPTWQKRHPFLHLLSLGVAVHLLMLALCFSLPLDVRESTFYTILTPALSIYPFATIVLGKYMLHCDKVRKERNEFLESEKRWQFALESAGEGIWDWNLTTNEAFYSSRWKSILDYTDEEIGHDIDAWKQLIHPDDRELVGEQFQRHLNGDTDMYSVEYRIRCRDGSYKWVLSRGRIIQFDSDGRALRFMGTQKDISDRKEKELELSYERFLIKELMDFVPEPIFFKDTDGKYSRANVAAAQALGCSSTEDIIGKSDEELVDPTFAKYTRMVEQDIMQKKKNYHQEELIVGKDGKERWGITNKLLLVDPTGKTVGTFGITVDITKQKAVEEALIESQRYTNSILESIPDLIFVLDSKGNYLDFKAGTQKDIEVDPELFLHKNMCEYLPLPLARRIQSAIDSALIEGEKVLLEYDMDVDGERMDFEACIVPFTDDKVLTLARNISYRKKVETDLKHSKEELKRFAGHLQNVREEERVLLSREIHDDLGQQLIALKIDIGIFRQEITKTINGSTEERLLEKLERILGVLNDAIKTTRKIMTGLRPAALELMGFYEAANQYLREFEQRYRLHCSLSSDRHDLQLNEQCSIALFRILQESLTNIVKHAKATDVQVVLSRQIDHLTMTVTDNGIGIDHSKPKRNDAYGLLGMKERVHLLGGSLRFDENPGGGTVVCVQVPLRNEPSADEP